MRILVSRATQLGPRTIELYHAVGGRIDDFGLNGDDPYLSFEPAPAPLAPYVASHPLRTEAIKLLGGNPPAPPNLLAAHPLEVRAFIKLRGVDSGFFDELLGFPEPSTSGTARTSQLVMYLSHLAPW